MNYKMNTSEMFFNSLEEINDYSKLTQVLDSLNIFFPLSITDSFGNIINVNKAFEETLGYEKEEIIGKTHSIIKHPDSKAEDFEDLWQTISNKKPYYGLLKNKHKNGTTMWHTTFINPITDENGEIIYYFCYRIDSTAFVQAHRKVSFIENYGDYGTLKKNSSLKKSLLKSQKGILLVVGIEKFSEIKAFLGEGFSRKLLDEFASRMNIFIHEYECYSLDELNLFAAYLKINKNDLVNEIELNKNIIEIKDELLRPYHIEGEKFPIGINIGVAHGNTKTLEQKGRLAYENANETGINIVFYKDQMNTKLKMYSENKLLIHQIKQSIDDNRVILHYQPIYSFDNNSIKKYECLVRMQNKEGKILYPDMFIDIAKKSKYYSNITKIVIEKSFDKFRDRNENFSININYDDISDDNIRDFLIQNIKNFKEPQRIIFEILEDQDTMQHIDEVKLFIKEVKELGCKVAIDDFGVGYSNFINIISFDIDYIKIDGEITKKIHEDSTKSILEGIVKMAKRKGIKVVAEFVENEIILNELKKLGIDEGQGYFIGKPSSELVQN